MQFWMLTWRFIENFSYTLKSNVEMSIFYSLNNSLKVHIYWGTALWRSNEQPCPGISYLLNPINKLKLKKADKTRKYILSGKY